MSVDGIKGGMQALWKVAERENNSSQRCNIRGNSKREREKEVTRNNESLSNETGDSPTLMVIRSHRNIVWLV